ncbi:hypothetical protein GCM10012290_12490 [Halolactibacillus alkaliphilus]|uniref:histidine kinase n=1 Tax=Halolactibacillus alkaliphilus TaxID=442899 RepID=A0A511X0V0_9BACI|nr:ATP-binding protein [Halolactibacillus alkaliphilus]GEN56576.1 hypothetical protein HAL01_10400 [Halolactibacillus alkaliphilus]GGN69588.1 hypothetical protein GCM10012290_12490 [Halolactibacillus alkaliphilus]SFO76602.1 PAS domain S-box-containing protein [Halolactibacillus alkaliphilus]
MKQTDKTIKIKRKFYVITLTLLAVIVAVVSVATLTLIRTQATINKEYEESTIKYNAINQLDRDLTGVLFRARGFYAFQSETELELLYKNLTQLDDSLAYFSSLDLTMEEEELYTILSEFYRNYTDDLLPLAIEHVNNDDYVSLRALANSGANTDINRFLEYTQQFNAESAENRDLIYEQTRTRITQFTIGFIVLGIVSFGLIILMVNRLLKEIVLPLELFIKATNDFSEGKKLDLAAHYQLDELNLLKRSFNKMAVKVQEKEEELLAQNEELLSQQDELESSQAQLQAYITDIEHINKALNQSALVCITNSDGMIISVNEMFCKVSKFSETDLVGNTTRVLKSGQHDVAFYKEMWATISKGKIWTGKLMNMAKDGATYWVNATIVPFLTDVGKVYRYILIGIDITENKQNEVMLQKLLVEAQDAKEKTEVYSNLNKELTVTVDREQFLHRVFNYLDDVFTFDKGILFSPQKKHYVHKCLSKEKIASLLSDDIHQEIIQRLKERPYYVQERLANEREAGIAEGTVYSYDLYAAVLNEASHVDLVFAATRIGQPFTTDEIEKVYVLMRQLNIALSRIDIYEEVQRERSLNESIIQNIDEGLQLVSLEGELLQTNHKFMEFFSQSFKEKRALKHWLSDISTQFKDAKSMKAFFEKGIAPDNISVIEKRCQLIGEQQRYIKIYSSPVFLNDKKKGTLFVYRDITKEYEIDEMKSELVSTVSHELRTPLSSVLGFTEMLLKKQLSPDKQTRYLETIFKEAKRLTNLINDFLDVQRIESGKQEYKMEKLRLSEVIMQVIETFNHDKRHPIYFEDQAVYTKVLADEDRLIQLLTNIISNALKFSPDGGNVAIKITNEEEKVKVSIKDEGIGIPSSELPNMFTKFKRIDNSASQKIGGTGLGLAISKGIVEAHGGDIWIESEEQVGTTVNFTLPLTDVNNIEPLTDFKVIGTTDLTKGTVIIIEDDISFAMLLSETLKSMGFSVIHDPSGKNIVKLAEDIDVLAIVVDLVLADDVSGWDLIKELKANEQTTSIPLIVSSAVDKSSDILESQQVFDYLLKPYSPNVLADVLLKLIQQAKDE